MRSARYIGWFAGTVLGLGLLTCALCIWVDPYRMFGTPPTRWTAVKPRIYERSEIAKTYQMERIRPRTLLLGNSRVEVGLDPESAAWSKDAATVFNAAEAGKGLLTALDMLRDAVALRPPRTIVLGVDIPDFLEQPSAPSAWPPPLYDEARRLLVDRHGGANPDRAMQVWRDRVAVTLTIDALFDSIATLAGQDAETGTTMTSLGFNPMHEYRLHARRSGYYALFAQKDAIYQSQLAREHPSDFADPSHYASFRYLESVMRVAKDNNSQLILYVHPYHARYLEILHKVGLWSSFEAWKRALVRVVAAENTASAPPIRLFDFSGYNEVTTERVPPAGDTATPMRWYWESGHYKHELGDLILGEIFGGHAKFGRELTPATIEGVLASIREDGDRFRNGIASNPPTGGTPR